MRVIDVQYNIANDEILLLLYRHLPIYNLLRFSRMEF